MNTSDKICFAIFVIIAFTILFIAIQGIGGENPDNIADDVNDEFLNLTVVGKRLGYNPNYNLMGSDLYYIDTLEYGEIIVDKYAYEHCFINDTIRVQVTSIDYIVCEVNGEAL